MPLILLSGTPGTGKTRVGLILSRRLHARFTTVTWLVLENRAWRSYDPDTLSYVIDEDRFYRVLEDVSRADLVLDTHWVEPFAAVGGSVRYCAVLRTNPLELWRRLERRGWPAGKIAENVEAELLGVVSREAFNAFPDRVYEVDTTGKKPVEAAEELLDAMRRGARSTRPIDWLELLSDEEISELLTRITRARAKEVAER